MLNSASDLRISSDLLTIIITTSPVPSAPSPDLIKTALNSLPASLSDVPLIITFDNFTVASNDHGRLKRGSIPQDLADRYPVYIDNVCKLFGSVSSATDDPDCLVSRSLHRDVVFLVSKRRNGFAFSVKLALDYVTTPYVMILQHDWLFDLHPPMSDLVSILQTEDEVRYISFIARMSLNYETSRGHSHRSYRHIFSEARQLRSDRPLSGELVACLHWFDRPHLCSVKTYRQIFDLAIVKRGDFIEDTFGTEYMKSMQNAPSKEAAFDQWKRWGAWLYYPGDGKLLTVRHQHGRKNLLGERQEERINNMIKSNRDKRVPSDNEKSDVHIEEMINEGLGLAFES